MGCCGHSFISGEKIKQSIKKNTQEFQEYDPFFEEDLLRYRDRAGRHNLRNGVCRNLIAKEGKIFCPLHPIVNNGKDLRKGHCDTDYFCETAKKFSFWNEQKQREFIIFIKSKKIDNITYSILIDKGTLLQEFEEIQKI